MFLDARMPRCLFSARIGLSLILGCVTAPERLRAADLEVRLVVNIPSWSPRDSTLWLTGEIPSLCNWKPQCLRMQKIGPLSYATSFRIPDNGADVAFKVTRGSWESEAADMWGRPLPNLYFSRRGTLVQEDGSLLQVVQDENTVSLPHWRDMGPRTLSGELRIFPKVFSQALGNTRAVRVLLPPSYSRDPGRRYPVVYWHDGQNLFDPATSNYGVDWGLDETLAGLYGEGQEREIIVVGLDSSDDRFPEYDPMLKGEKYLSFLTDEVKPLIDREFRTLPGRDDTWIAGSSMGALISVAALWSRDDIFSKALAVSLPAAIQSRALERYMRLHPEGPRQPVKLWMDHGDRGLDVNYGPSAQKFFDELQRRGWGDAVQYHIYPNAIHEEADWNRRSEDFLKWLLAR
jgi:predicted alpha/beta superfamily hydrolase